MTTIKQLPLVLAITGASGSIYGLRLLQYLLETKQPVELIISRGALKVMQEELDLSFKDNLQNGILSYLNLAPEAPLTLHHEDNCGASIASGSYHTQGMAVVPCSLGSLGSLAAGLTGNLIQ